MSEVDSLIAASHDEDAWAERHAEMASLDATAPDLSEYLEGDLDADLLDGDPPPDVDFANRILRKLARLNRDIAEVVERADRERERINDYEMGRNGRRLREKAKLEGWVESWMRAHHERTGRVTEHLLNGELKLREGQPSFICSDPKAFWKWCMTTPSERAKWVSSEVWYKPDAGKLRHHLKPGEALGSPDEKGVLSFAAHDPETGELVPTVTIRKPAQKTFKYELSP